MEVGGRLMRLVHQLNLAGMRNFPATPAHDSRWMVEVEAFAIVFRNSIDGSINAFSGSLSGLSNVCFVSPRVSRSFDMIKIAVCPKECIISKTCMTKRRNLTPRIEGLESKGLEHAGPDPRTKPI